MGAMWTRAAGLILLLAVSASPASADGRIDPGEVEAARAMLEKLTDTTGVAATHDRIKAQFRERMLTANPDREAEIDAVFEEVVRPELAARFAAIMERRAEAMALAMTPDMIKANSEFWTSGTGEAVLAVPRGDNFEELVFEGMKDRLGIFDGLAVRNRMTDLADAVRKHADAANAARAAAAGGK